MLKKMFSIDALTEYGALGAGEISARLVNNRVSPLILKDAKTYQNFSPAVPIILGAVLSKGIGGNFLGNLGRGMIANGVGNVISRLVDKDGTIGLTGGDEVLMAGDEVLMRGGSGNSFDAGDAYDYTASEAGEMDH
jgi:hypothetical protein